MKTGRNDPCPCGSGKKYKKCCLTSGPDPVSYMKQKLERFHERIVRELFRHAEKIFSYEALESAADEFFGWPDEEEVESFDLDGHGTVFYPWFLFKWRIESADGESELIGPRDQSVVQSYLQRYGKKLDPVERKYLERIGGAPFSFFEIIAVKPGESITLHDLLLDSDHHVLEKTASQTLQASEVVFGSVLEAGGICLFGALGPIPFTPVVKIDILDMREVMAKSTNDGITVDTLEEYDLELRELYLDHYRARTAMPALCNTDGDTLSFHTLKYTISTPQTVFTALKGLTNGFATEEELLDEAEFDADGNIKKVEIPWLMPANAGHGGMENTLHGRLMIDGTTMTCEVNSDERAARLRSLIEKSLPGKEAAYQISMIESPTAKMNEAPPDDFFPEENEELMNHPEVRDRIEQMMRKHWEAWPDMELPALHGKTPRQAVRDEPGRRQVNALLEDAEYRCRSGDDAMYTMENLQKVRRTLGLETL